MGQKIVGSLPAGGVPRDQRFFCQVGSCFMGQRPSRFTVSGTPCCLWHFPETFARNYHPEDSGLPPMTIDVLTERRFYDRPLLILRAKYLKLSGRL